MQDKYWNWNEIQYNFEVEDDQVNPSYHQKQEKNKCDAEEKCTDYQWITKINQNNILL